jgi:pectate lyase
LVCALLPAGHATASGPRGVGPVGWASVNGGTTGGLGAGPESVWTVSTRAELKEALANRGDPTAPKVIRVEGDISGHEAGDGTLVVAIYGGTRFKDTGARLFERGGRSHVAFRQRGLGVPPLERSREWGSACQASRARPGT